MTMVVKSVARHGDWESPISLDDVAAKTKAFASPRVSRKTGRIFYTETRDDGEKTIMEVLKGGSEVKEILPHEYVAANTVYNYGGATMDCLPDGRIVFSNKDNTVKILDPETSSVEDLVSNATQRYSDFSANTENDWIVANEEDHTIDTPPETRNRVVAINWKTGEVNRIVDGPDFVWVPQFSHDGTKIAWMEWDHPDMAWYSARLFWANLNIDNGTLGRKHLITGGLAAGAAEPRWGPDGSLFFGAEAHNYRQLYRLKPSEKNVTHVTRAPDLQEFEFGELRLFQGSRTYAPLSEKTLVAGAHFNGLSRLIAIDLDSGDWKYIADAEHVNQVQYDAVTRLDDESIIGVFTGDKSTSSVRIVNATEPSQNKLVRRSSSLTLEGKIISDPELISIPAKSAPKRDVHGFLWLPKNPKYTAPEGELPPLVVVTHGGPTGHYGPGLNLRTQYLTSRGYAVFFLNYTGSTAHGRRHRQLLWGNWGIVDADDAAEIAEHLVSSGRVRAGSVGCTGLSAGGYNTLQCVTRHPKTWAGAVDVSGICDLETFNQGTHKLEWHYTDALVLDRDDASEEEKLRVYKERSALYHTDAIKTPLLILHAMQDTVVPMNQATDMAEALEKLDKEVKLVKVDNDGHMLAKPPSARIWLHEEEQWWRKTLL